MWKAIAILSLVLLAPTSLRVFAAPLPVDIMHPEDHTLPLLEDGHFGVLPIISDGLERHASEPHLIDEIVPDPTSPLSLLDGGYFDVLPIVSEDFKRRAPEPQLIDGITLNPTSASTLLEGGYFGVLPAVNNEISQGEATGTGIPTVQS